ncbi:MAG: lipoyl(octanoyl) transferase LipB [Planctomycetota bacterium]
MPAPPEVIDWGRVAYRDAWQRQLELVLSRARGAIADQLILCEHDAVITSGRGTPRASLAGLPFPLVEVERGGELTYHGPGQLVGYPIVDLRARGHDLHRYLRDLEELLLRALLAFGLAGRREPGRTGVWVGQKKIGSIGVAVKRWVAYHGFALNVSTDLGAFTSFSPCGLRPEVMTSMRALGCEVLLDDVKPRVSESFAAVFGVTRASTAP